MAYIIKLENIKFKILLGKLSYNEMNTGMPFRNSHPHSKIKRKRTPVKQTGEKQENVHFS